jgi:hypothetical protein
MLYWIETIVETRDLVSLLSNFNLFYVNSTCIPIQKYQLISANINRNLSIMLEDKPLYDGSLHLLKLLYLDVFHINHSCLWIEEKKPVSVDINQSCIIIILASQFAKVSAMKVIDSIICGWKILRSISPCG